MSNAINPEHYNRLNPQPKDVIRAWGLNFNLGSAVKYISRAGHKDDIVQDLKKAQEFIQFEIDAIEGARAERKDKPKHEDTPEMDNWVDSCMRAEKTYNYLISEGRTPQEARSVLPNSLKTEVVMTANLREWRHFLSLRACGSTGKPHPQMLEVAVPLLKELRERVPVVFDDLEPMEWETVK